MFTAISGRSMKMIARYLAEKGTKLSTLELLMASQSVWGTVESHILMRRMTIVGANLLFLWSLSPLGGQASLRLLEIPALLDSKQAKERPEDIWGNVKIPYLNTSSLLPDTQRRWFNVSGELRAPEEYFSLVGIPVISRPLLQDGTFNLESSQLTLECDSFTQFTVNRFDCTQLQSLVPGYIWKRMSNISNPWDGHGIGGRLSTFFLETDLPLTDGNNDSDGRFNSYYGYVNASTAGKTFAKRQITYASMFRYKPGGTTTLNTVNCSLGQVHAETVVECKKEKFSATQVRLSLIDLRDTNTTPFDHILISQLALTAFPKTFGWPRGSNPTEQFMYNSSSFRFVSPISYLSDNPGWVNLAELDPSVFARRLALLLNTYYQFTIAPTAFLGGLPQPNLSAFGLDTMPVTDVDVYLPSNMTTRNSPFKDCLLLVAARTVLLIGTASLILKRRTLGPALFGFVSSMTYGKPFIQIPEDGSMLNAVERARLLKDVEVVVGDVRGDAEVGHIALAAGVPMRTLEKDRLYH
ncbi:hypothetical protein BDU57DRAFT_541261 [Ampelomyces quisqualis]|uniref:Uncharacterized protein n=1 Tax=Ampelomyces quisqualis TaxID=50730 RepID=A0A6A5QET9_AMPQU|nr:hypothetical protein BDU57DRAFT_541261 [Ampelomyces quisqualis]